MSINANTRPAPAKKPLRRFLRDERGNQPPEWITFLSMALILIVAAFSRLMRELGPTPFGYLRRALAPNAGPTLADVLASMTCCTGGLLLFGLVSLAFSLFSLGDQFVQAQRRQRYDQEVERLSADPRAVDLLVDALEDQRDGIRRRAARALGDIGDSRAVQPLIATFAEDGTWGLPQDAVEALGAIGDPAVEPLIDALEHGHSKVRELAAKALGEIGDPHALKPLLAALSDEQPGVRVRAAKGLGEIGDPRAVGRLVVALDDRKKHVRKAAAEALDRLDWEPPRQ